MMPLVWWVASYKLFRLRLPHAFKREVLVGDGAPCDYSEHYEQNP